MSLALCDVTLVTSTNWSPRPFRPFRTTRRESVPTGVLSSSKKWTTTSNSLAAPGSRSAGQSNTNGSPSANARSPQ